MAKKSILVPDWCNTCDAQRYFLADALESSRLLRCKQCGTLSSSVWCPKCGMGGDFVKSIPERPSQWECPQCHRQYPLSPDFYASPVDLIRDIHVPPEHKPALERLTSKPKGLLPSSNQAIAALALPAAAVLLAGFAMLLAVHILSLLTHTYLFPFPQAFFLLAAAALAFGIAPGHRYIASISPVLRWVPFALFIYSVVIYFALGQVTGGQRMVDLPPDTAAEAVFVQGLCIQGFLLGVILLGGLILWYRTRRTST